MVGDILVEGEDDGPRFLCAIVDLLVACSSEAEFGGVLDIPVGFRLA